MAAKWYECTLGDVVTLQRGIDLPAREREVGNIPVVASTGITGFHNKAAAQGPGVVIGRSGSIGGGQFIAEDFWPLNTTLWVKDFRGNNPRFCYYLLKSMNLSGLNAGSGVPTLNRNHLHPLPVLCPPLAEQHAIAETLGTFDDRIDNLRQTNATLEAIVRALFKSWFVDFDSLPSEKMQESELGLIPTGWRIEEIGKLVQCVGGATPSTKDESFWIHGAHRWATPKDLSKLQAPVLTTTERCITDAGLARISSGLLPTGTLLMSSRAPIGYLAIAAMPVAINQGFIAMLPGGALSPVWLLWWAKVNMEVIKQKANGSTFMEINKTAFRSIKVVKPPPDALAQFDEVAGPILDRIMNNEHKIASLTQLRDTLLPRLISGQIQVTQ